MKLQEIYAKNKKIISFEVFPPKDNQKLLLKEIKKLNKFNPAFISLTCGAGGQENKSFKLIEDIQSLDISVMPHFTCITSSKKSIEDRLNYIEKLGIENILALRGDLPKDPSFICKDFCYANELVNFIKNKTNLSIGVAGYPEGHIESLDLKTDIENLKRKVDEGADAIFTQLFFNNNKFFDYVEKVRKAGISIPIVCGIMPIISRKQVLKMTSLAKITVPKFLEEMLERYENDPISLTNFGIIHTSAQCEGLISNGFKFLHFYTLNKSYSTFKILENIKEIL